MRPLTGFHMKAKLSNLKVPVMTYLIFYFSLLRFSAVKYDNDLTPFRNKIWK